MDSRRNSGTINEYYSPNHQKYFLDTQWEKTKQDSHIYEHSFVILGKRREQKPRKKKRRNEVCFNFNFYYLIENIALTSLLCRLQKLQGYKSGNQANTPPD